MKRVISKFLEKNNIFLLLLGGLFFRLFIANFGTLDLDHGTFIAWSSSLVTNGLKNFYSDWSDYFPGYLYVLYLLGKLNLILPEYTTLIYKLPAIFADVLVSFLIYKIVFKFKAKKDMALLFSSFYLFNPAIFYNSSLWGQVDGLIALFTLFAIYIFEKNIFISAITLAIGTLIKPQAAFILPSILYLFIKTKKSISSYIIYAFTGLSTFILGFIPFNNKGNLYEFILDRFNVSANQYPYGSVNAFSFWGVFGFWKPDNNILWVGLAVSVAIIAISTLLIFRKKIIGGEYLIAGISLLTTFTFVTRMHERHLLPSLAFILVGASLNYLNLIVYFVLSLTYISNLQYAYIWITKEFKEIFNPTLIRMFIATNILSLLTLVVSLFKKIEKIPSIFSKLSLKNDNLNLPVFKNDFTHKKAMKILFLIIIFNLATKFYALNNPKDMYFDEIYHAFTAKLVLHNDPKAWEWWNPHPEGFAYEWTHPPLSKLMMALSMKVFGENQVGWRIPQAIFGTLSVVIVYFLSFEIFKDRKLSLIAASLLSLDGLLLVLSRMGMNDTYVLAFTLLAVLFFIKDKNLLSSISLGLAIASKWSAIYTLPILFVAHFAFKKKLKINYLLLLVVPIFIYVLSYSFMFATGHTWSQFVEVQKQMWWYHTNLDATHPYTSPAWSWPILLRPIYLYDGGVENNITSRIYASGNPIVFWFGVISMLLSFVIAGKEKNKQSLAGFAGKRLGFIVFSYLVLFLPWIASPRIMFLYHYLPSIPYMVIASAFILRRFKKLSSPILFLSLLLFIYFYPHWTAIKIPLKLDESYYWFSSWR